MYLFAIEVNDPTEEQSRSTGKVLELRTGDACHKRQNDAMLAVEYNARSRKLLQRNDDSVAIVV